MEPSFFKANCCASINEATFFSSRAFSFSKAVLVARSASVSSFCA